jgi:hypothetical protein
MHGVPDRVYLRHLLAEAGIWCDRHQLPGVPGRLAGGLPLPDFRRWSPDWRGDPGRPQGLQWTRGLNSTADPVPPLPARLPATGSRRARGYLPFMDPEPELPDPSPPPSTEPQTLGPRAAWARLEAPGPAERLSARARARSESHRSRRSWAASAWLCLAGDAGEGAARCRARTGVSLG